MPEFLKTPFFCFQDGGNDSGAKAFKFGAKDVSSLVKSGYDLRHMDL